MYIHVSARQTCGTHHEAEHSYMYQSMCGIQKINEPEVVQGRLDSYIPKQEIIDTIQYTVERSWLKHLSFLVLYCTTSNCDASDTELLAVTRKVSITPFVHRYNLSFSGA